MGLSGKKSFVNSRVDEVLNASTQREEQKIGNGNSKGKGSERGEETIVKALQKS